MVQSGTEFPKKRAYSYYFTVKTIEQTSKTKRTKRGTKHTQE